MLGLLLGACLLLLAANLWRLSQPGRPDPKMVGLAVRATLYAVPSPTPHIIEVTRVVEVVVTATPSPRGTATATATATTTLTVTPTAKAAGVSMSAAPPAGIPPTDSFVAAMGGSMAARQAAVAQSVAVASAAEEWGAALWAAEAEPEPIIEPAAEPEPETTIEPTAEPTAEPTPEPTTEPEPAQPVAAEPIAAQPVASDCPTSSSNSYTTVPVAGGSLTHPDSLHADLNLAVRGYVPSDAVPALFDKDGPVDGDPPQLAGIFGDFRLPAFGASFRVFDWNWNCGEHGCRGGLTETGASTLLTLLASPGEPLGVPHRGAQIYGGGYKALVLYAESNRLTLGYTREDSVANGYAIHLENICVDPNLLALYQSSSAAGRGHLPALREDEVLGTTGSGQIMVAVRDRGVFFDPRSRLDWWWGF